MFIKVNFECWVGCKLGVNLNVVINWILLNNIRVVFILICKNISFWNFILCGWNGKMVFY